MERRPSVQIKFPEVSVKEVFNKADSDKVVNPVSSDGQMYSTEQLYYSQRRNEAWSRWMYDPEVQNKNVFDLYQGSREEDNPVYLLNVNPDFVLSPDIAKDMFEVIENVSNHFPKITNELAVVTEYIQRPSVLDDENNFPLNGLLYGNGHFGIIKLMPRSFDDTPHRVNNVTNLVGSLAHELGHAVDKSYKNDWSAIFGWGQCNEFPEFFEDLGSIPNPDGYRKYKSKVSNTLFHKKQFTQFPEELVNHYAGLDAREDFAESFLCYFYNPELLKKVSPRKFDFINSMAEENKDPKEMVVRQITDIDEMKTILQPDKDFTVKYFVDPPAVFM